MFHNLIHNATRHVDWYGEANSDIAATRGKDRGVDADKLTPQVHQRAARITWVDGRICLDEILVSLFAYTRATERADNAGRHRLAKAKRIADGDHEVADVKPITITHWDSF
jgi:hypothetical protein